MSLQRFVRISRDHFQNDKRHVRFVYISEFHRRTSNDEIIDQYFQEKVPYFYREAKRISDSFLEGFFSRAVLDTLRKLPKSPSFQESHFGEITSGIFAEDLLGLKKIYSKLSLLTAENANAFKIDLLLYDPVSNPIEIYFCEVKCSVQKMSDDLSPVGHDKSIYPSLFQSMNEYSKNDEDFDFAAAKDHIDTLPIEEQTLLKKALLPYSDAIRKYIGFIVIDSSTINLDEISVLATRKNEKDFNVDLICLDQLPTIVQNVYSHYDRIREALENRTD